MAESIAADLVLLTHLGFVLFAIFGGLLVLWRPWLAWLHLPAALWGILIELFGWVCPLTPLENQLRQAAGETAYHRGFIEHYIVSLLYPEALTRALQIWLAIGLLLANILIYGYVMHRRKTSAHTTR